MATQSDPLLDPTIVTLVTNAITAAVTYAVARVTMKTKAVEKAPEVQDQINKAVASLIAHYTKALEEEEARHADHVQEIEQRFDQYEAWREQIMAAMTQAGIAIPALGKKEN